MNISKGYGTMFPYLFVNNTEKYIEFLKESLSAEKVGRTTAPNGTIANSRIRIGTTTFMVSEASEKYPATKSTFYLYVENAESAFRNAIRHGAKAIFEPVDMPYGDRQGAVSDLAENIWWISQRLVSEPYDK